MSDNKNLKREEKPQSGLPSDQSYGSSIEVGQPLPTSLLGLPVSAPSSQILIRCLETPLKSGVNRAHYLANVGFKTLLDARESEPLHRALTTANHLFPTGPRLV
jgi:hypothetical protein